MDIKITGKHIAITDEIRDRIEEKISGFPKYYSSVLAVEVIVESGKAGQQSTVEIIARAKHNHTLVASQSGSDVYACVDEAVKKVERQLVKQKQKERDNKHSGEAQQEIE